MISATQPVADTRTRRFLCVARRAMACEFSLWFPAHDRHAAPAGCAALDEVERLEGRLSAYLEDSDLSRLNRKAARHAMQVDGQLFGLLALAARLSRDTGGAFDIAAGALVKAWGFYRGPRRVPSDTELRQALARSGMRHLALDPQHGAVRFLHPGLELNLGAIGKGYAIDRALARIGARAVLMQAGQSSLRAVGAPPGEPRGWRVAIGDPLRPHRTIATVWLRNRALGTSAAAHQWFDAGGRRYGHVLDPRSGRPADEIAAASALAPTAAEADALSTAFFVLGVEPTLRYCRRHPAVGAVLVTKSAQVIVAGDGDQVELHT